MQIPPDVYRKIIEAKWYIDENFKESIDLNAISRKACISRFHFHRLFTRIYHKTPHQYLTRKRIECARELLVDRAVSIREVCNEVGFESIGSFSILFKKEIGYTPQYYRNMAWLKKQQSEQQPLTQIPRCFVDWGNP
jgi:AraC-like DNA-binding protein